MNDLSLNNKKNDEHLKYVSGGLLGDLIHNLSVINENYVNTGKRGILYISNKYGGDDFTYGMEKSFNDIKEIISNQNYLVDFKLHNGEAFDINLNEWRNSDLLYHDNWHSIYKKTYNIEWGSRKWLNVPYDSRWENKIVINTSSRFPNNISYEFLKEHFGESLVYVSYNVADYETFIEKSKINIFYYKCTSFTELCTIINSCKQFIGSLSAPLSIAHALHKDRIVGLDIYSKDNVHVLGLNNIWKNLILN